GGGRGQARPGQRGDEGRQRAEEEGTSESHGAYLSQLGGAENRYPSVRCDRTAIRPITVRNTDLAHRFCQHAAVEQQWTRREQVRPAGWAYGEGCQDAGEQPQGGGDQTGQD